MVKKTELVEVPGSSMALLDDFSAEAGSGLENVTARDVMIPRLTILQSLSPQVNRNKPEYIAGASAGDICDVGTGEVIPLPLIFIPVYFKKQWLEWAPRTSGRGLVNIHNSPNILDETKLNQRGQPALANGNLISETAQFFGLNMNAGGKHSFLPLTSTQLKKSKRWLALATSEKLARADGSFYTPPLYYRAYRLSSVPESNAQGDWMGWRIDRDISIIDFPNWKAVKQDAIEFQKAIIAGEIRGDISEDATGDKDDEHM
jgi:hypothetical protein